MKLIVLIFSRWKLMVFFFFFFFFFKFSFRVVSDVEISESDHVLLSGLVDTCWLWPSSDSGLESDMSSCFLDVLRNDGKSLNFSASQLVLGSVSFDDGNDESVAAWLAQLKPNEESYKQESASCFLSFFCVIFAVERRWVWHDDCLQFQKHYLLRQIIWLVCQSKARFTNIIFVFLYARTSFLAPAYLCGFDTASMHNW